MSAVVVGALSPEKVAAMKAAAEKARAAQAARVEKNTDRVVGEVKALAEKARSRNAFSGGLFPPEALLGALKR